MTKEIISEIDASNSVISEPKALKPALCQAQLLIASELVFGVGGYSEYDGYGPHGPL